MECQNQLLVGSLDCEHLGGWLYVTAFGRLYIKVYHDVVLVYLDKWDCRKVTRLDRKMVYAPQ